MLVRRQVESKKDSVLSQNAIVNRILNSSRTSANIDTAVLERLFADLEREAEKSVHHSRKNGS